MSQVSDRHNTRLKIPVRFRPRTLVSLLPISPRIHQAKSLLSFHRQDLVRVVPRNYRLSTRRHVHQSNLVNILRSHLLMNQASFLRSSHQKPPVLLPLSLPQTCQA
jgi:hypothetical protein